MGLAYEKEFSASLQLMSEDASAAWLIAEAMKGLELVDVFAEPLDLQLELDQALLGVHERCHHSGPVQSRPQSVVSPRYA